MISVYKNEGETPLQCLERIRIEQGLSSDLSMTYAGRLDPLACGILIVLVGEECKEKGKYLGSDKEYEFEILVGFSTDTLDILGEVTQSANTIEASCVSVIKETLESFVGKQMQSYPAFSSKTVNGTQLFTLAREGALPEVLPSHEIQIYSIEMLGEYLISKNDLQKDILNRIDKVSGDFRQDLIKTKWNEVLLSSPLSQFTIIKCRAFVSSGTYIRQLVSDLSFKINIPLTTYAICRTKIANV